MTIEFKKKHEEQIRFSTKDTLEKDIFSLISRDAVNYFFLIDKMNKWDRDFYYSLSKQQRFTPSQPQLDTLKRINTKILKACQG